MVRLACRVFPARAVPSGFACRSATARERSGTFSTRRASRSIKVSCQSKKGDVVNERCIHRQSWERSIQVNERHHSSWRSRGSWLALALLLLLALAACSPGGATNTGSGPQATSTHQPAPIHVPSGYHGMIVISFDASTTYEQAKTAVESAGLTLQVP